MRFLRIQQEFGMSDRYIEQFLIDTPIQNIWDKFFVIPSDPPESNIMSHYCSTCLIPSKLIQ